MNTKTILEQLKENDIDYIQELYYDYNYRSKDKPDVGVICKFPNGRIYNYYNALEKGTPLVGPFESIEEAEETLKSHRSRYIKIWTNPEHESAAGVLNLSYITHFFLENEVNDFDAAYNYLIEDDMTQYALYHSDIPTSGKDKIEKIEWILQNPGAGIIEVKTNNYLTDKESKSISEWINGQCSDGLMENFGQNFGYYEDKYGDITSKPYDEDGNENEFYPAEPDWATNSYELLLQE